MYNNITKCRVSNITCNAYIRNQTTQILLVKNPSYGTLIPGNVILKYSQNILFVFSVLSFFQFSFYCL
jgi:hypothetical protein